MAHVSTATIKERAGVRKVQTSNRGAGGANGLAHMEEGPLGLNLFPNRCYEKTKINMYKCLSICVARRIVFICPCHQCGYENNIFLLCKYSLYTTFAPPPLPLSPFSFPISSRRLSHNPQPLHLNLQCVGQPQQRELLRL